MHSLALPPAVGQGLILSHTFLLAIPARTDCSRECRVAGLVRSYRERAGHHHCRAAAARLHARNSSLSAPGPFPLACDACSSRCCLTTEAFPVAKQLEKRCVAKPVGGASALNLQRLRDELGCVFDDAQAHAFRAMDEVLPSFLARLDRSELSDLRSTTTFFTMEDLVLGRALGSSNSTDDGADEAGCRIS